jgi:hypothetical protein
MAQEKGRGFPAFFVAGVSFRLAGRLVAGRGKQSRRGPLRRSRVFSILVMAGLVPAIHV